MRMIMLQMPILRTSKERVWPGSFQVSRLSAGGRSCLACHRVSATQLRAFGRVAIHVPLKKITPDECTSTARVFAVIGLLGVMVELMTIP